MKKKFLLVTIFLLLNISLFILLGLISLYAIPIQIFIILLFSFKKQFEKDLSNKNNNE